MWEKPACLHSNKEIPLNMNALQPSLHQINRCEERYLFFRLSLYKLVIQYWSVVTFMWHGINAFITSDSWWWNNHYKYVCVKDGTLSHSWWAVDVGRRWMLARKPMRKCFILPAKWGDFGWSSLLQMAVYGLILERRSEPYYLFCSIWGRHTLDCEEKFLFQFHLSCRLTSAAGPTSRGTVD